jgi:hypothetical protein
MSEEKKEKSVDFLMDGAKIAIPFAMAMWTIFNVSAGAKEERAIIRKEISQSAKERAELKGENIAVKTQVHSNTISLTELKIDLKYIKDSQEETITLLRTMMRERR